MARALQASHNAPGVLTPQGRLTLTTATPVMSSEAANQTTIYYTPYVGDRIPLYNGTEWENKLFTELSIAMAASANWAANKNFDLFVANDAGTLRLVTGPAWSSDTARGTGAGTTELERKNGLWTNKVSMTGRYGASSTMTVDANEGTYVGTMRTTGSAGTTTWELGGDGAGGNPGFLYVWNAYNRVAVAVENHDSTDTWTYNTATWRQWNNSNSNRVSFVIGLAGEEAVSATFCAGGSQTSGGAAGTATQYICVGYDATNAIDGISSFYAVSDSVASSNTHYPVLAAKNEVVPGIGYHYMAALEYGTVAGAGAVTWYGDGGTGTLARFGMMFSGMF